MRVCSSQTFRQLVKCNFKKGRNMATTSTLCNNDEVTFNIKNNKGVITLNRPKSLNALNLPMINEMYPILKKWSQENRDMVIIEGAGTKAFCAGGDVVAVTTAPQEIRGTEKQTEFFKKEYQLNHLIGTLGIPYVALIDGITMGGGVGLSVHGKYRVATEHTLFAMPETGIGLFPDVGGSFFMPKLKGGLGMYLALTGYRLKGADCVHAGIATHICKQQEIENLKNDLLNLENNAEDNIIAVLNKYDSEFPKEKFTLENLLPNIDECFMKESVEEILKCLDSKDDSWSTKTRKQFNSFSPTSVKITFEQLSRGKQLSTLKECLQMEYRLACRCCEDSDFYEGIRALLIDKDKNPQWQPSSIAEVTESIVERYFSQLPSGRELKL